MKDFYKSVTEALGDELTKALAIALCIVLLFTGGYFTGSITNPAKAEDAPVVNVPESIPEVPQSTTPSTEPTEKPSVAPSENSGEAEPSEPAENEAGTMSVAEIVELYNKSANKVKTDAVKVVKNYEDREMPEDKLQIPGVLKALASSLIPTLMGDDTDPIEYATREEITENFMVPGQSYGSVLTEADVVEATCTDNGTEYEIMIKVKNEQNPVVGKGVGAAFDVIEASEIAENENAKMLESFVAEYYDCVLKCKIDKATGNMTWANYMTPLVLDVVVNMFGTHEAAVGLSFEKDYNMFY